ncbi:hypothetical protein FC756_03670 [Lysinibacillus mangiferihumi]|uniref:Uncharacterized protein n=1 Tax=Lysinibacillus mangiferihumi TaxID=1130819 RepID=A0A4U2ZCB2_9BACI|nr:hypothetical protein [Lysinibacillus mangiferihumi]TKI71904.1 hypothetical protein FC756_03670 [Lysinibacillus mangiferihumi]
MTSITDLKNAIDNLLSLSSTGAILHLNSHTPERAFEAYIFSLCSKAVKNLGATTTATATLTGTQSGPNPSIVIFRGSPGNMWSVSQDFCYLDCTLNDKSFEVHVDVTYEGRSGANHELDVSIYSKAQANIARSNRVFPKMQKHLIGAIECKFYTSAPGVSLARTFVGLLTDCSGKKFKAFISNQATDGLKKFLSTGPALSFTDLSPLDVSSEDRFVKNLEQFLLEWSHTR